MSKGQCNSHQKKIEDNRKSGNLSDVDNLRAIAISTAISKIFETVIETYVTSDSDVDQYQFGFKKQHSTALCTNVLKNTTPIPWES